MVFLLNKSIVHSINDLFWNMGFKHETQTEKVILIILINCSIRRMIIIVITNYTHYLQVRADLGIADHVWQYK